MINHIPTSSAGELLRAGIDRIVADRSDALAVSVDTAAVSWERDPAYPLRPAES